MKKRIVVALGGNALGDNPKDQIAAAKMAAVPIVDLIEEGHEVVVCHGNGPQVGMIDLAFEEGSKVNQRLQRLSLASCVAMSQTYIGFDLQRAIKSELKRRNIDIHTGVLMTQVVVDGNDPAFKNPTKPIGGFYSKEEGESLREQGYTVVEDSGRGYRRVVASPLPVDIEEKEIIKTIINSGQLLITVGGGGIPVVRKGNELVEVAAVVDKDWAGEKLAEIIDADFLVILTNVEKVAINYGKENQQQLDILTPETARKYIEEGQFAPGSMLPKVEAALKFVSSKAGRQAIITKLETAKDGIAGRTGTQFHL